MTKRFQRAGLRGTYIARVGTVIDHVRREPCTDTRWDHIRKKKKPPADGNTLDRGRRVEGLGARKLCGQADIFPIRLELMYRQYYDDASKAT